MSKKTEVKTVNEAVVPPVKGFSMSKPYAWSDDGHNWKFVKLVGYIEDSLVEEVTGSLLQVNREVKPGRRHWVVPDKGKLLRTVKYVADSCNLRSTTETRWAVEVLGRKYTYDDVLRCYGVSKSGLARRLKGGWPLRMALRPEDYVVLNTQQIKKISKVYYHSFLKEDSVLADSLYVAKRLAEIYSFKLALAAENKSEEDCVYLQKLCNEKVPLCKKGTTFVDILEKVGDIGKLKLSPLEQK